jgi:hypothetical protein
MSWKIHIISKSYKQPVFSFPALRNCHLHSGGTFPYNGKNKLNIAISKATLILFPGSYHWWFPVLWFVYSWRSLRRQQAQNILVSTDYYFYYRLSGNCTSFLTLLQIVHHFCDQVSLLLMCKLLEKCLFIKWNFKNWWSSVTEELSYLIQLLYDQS